MTVNFDRMDFMHSPEVLYKCAGFANIDKLKEYGNLQGGPKKGHFCFSQYF